MSVCQNYKRKVDNQQTVEMGGVGDTFSWGKVFQMTR